MSTEFFIAVAVLAWLIGIIFLWERIKATPGHEDSKPPRDAASAGLDHAPGQSSGAPVATTLSPPESDMIRPAPHAPFRSHDESLIAATLGQKGIPFVYEPYLHLRDGTVLRPDFWLPDHGVFIEYWGLHGEADYDVRARKKRAAYIRANVPVVSLWPKSMYKLDRSLHAALRDQDAQRNARPWRLQPSLDGPIHIMW